LAIFELSGGTTIKRDPEQALKRARAACDAGFPPGCTLLGGLVVQGLSGKPDVQEAAGLFKRGCEGGDANGCAYYGAQMLEGQGMDRDAENGLKILERSCRAQGSLQGCSMFARALVLGQGGKARVAEGAEQAEKLCKLGEVQSCLIAGVAFGQGKGVKRDIPRAAGLVVRACAAGFGPACQLEQRLPKDVVAKAKAALKIPTNAAPGDGKAPESATPPG
jgi:TPR repeat protein